MYRRQKRFLAFGLLVTLFAVVSLQPTIRADKSKSRESRDPPLRNTTPSFSTIDVSHSSTDSITLSIAIAEVTRRNINVDGTLYHRVSLDGTEPYGVTGAPDIPVFRKLLAIPDCDAFDIEVSSKGGGRDPNERQRRSAAQDRTVSLG